MQETHNLAQDDNTMQVEYDKTDGVIVTKLMKDLNHNFKTETTIDTAVQPTEGFM